MSDKSEQMRPIPDGGLKDSMPSWLKRPPAWRELPTMEERHERTLPEPDTSEIDPHSLVDVSDLPQWLQAIAARGEVLAPLADERQSAPVDEIVDPAVIVESASLPQEQTVTTGSEVLTIDTGQPDVPEVPTETTTVTTEPPATGMPAWLMPLGVVMVLVIVVVLFYVL